MRPHLSFRRPQWGLVLPLLAATACGAPGTSPVTGPKRDASATATPGKVTATSRTAGTEGIHPPGAAMSQGRTRRTPAADEEPLTVRSLPWIKVENHRLIDAYGRDWLLRGINARIDGVFDVTFDDGRTALEDIPAFDALDAAQMASFGFNYLRLPINWSALEPNEGELSDAYLERVDQVIALAKEAGLYVLVDFHQDAWSKEIGEDGAPLWAIVPAPKRLLEGPLDDLTLRRMSPQVMEAFHSFFKNTDQLQDRFMPAWQSVVSRYADDPGVIGFELMNEPVAYYALCRPSDLYDYYAKAAEAMRAVDSRHTLWLEPDASRNQLLSAPLRALPFADDNVVYEPHLYPPVSYDSTQAWIDGLTDTFDKMVAEANSWGAALVLGEWGTHPDDSGAPAYIEAVQTLADQRQFGQTFWLWKEISQGYWGLFDYDADTDTWTERSGAGLEALRRPAVMAVPGRLLSATFDASSETVAATFDAGGGEGAPLVYIPEGHYPGGARVELDGVEVEVDIDPDTRRALVPWSGQAGTHQLVIRPR